ncbi:hypothetical protein [Levilactobacillus andaensis]|uniref:hypothetical protein n=1 Tax=Levilactobacillus andaensis TaxID=2799570 RepID=UPI001941A09B|nr:hypothetical protein [Levilactobacillus andaensis]
MIDNELQNRLSEKMTPMAYINVISDLAYSDLFLLKLDETRENSIFFKVFTKFARNFNVNELMVTNPKMQVDIYAIGLVLNKYNLGTPLIRFDNALSNYEMQYETFLKLKLLHSLSKEVRVPLTIYDFDINRVNPKSMFNEYQLTWALYEHILGLRPALNLSEVMALLCKQKKWNALAKYQMVLNNDFWLNIIDRKKLNLSNLISLDRLQLR